MAANERLEVGRARDAGEIAVEYHLGHTGGDFDLRFQDVRLRREEQSLIQLPGCQLVCEGMRGLDEHLVGPALALRGVDGHADRPRGYSALVAICNKYSRGTTQRSGLMNHHSTSRPVG